MRYSALRLAYQLATPGLHGHRALQQRDAAFRVVGVGGDHAEQGERRGIVRRCGQHVVADAGGLAEAPGLCRRLGSGERLVRRLGSAYGCGRDGSAHADEVNCTGRRARPAWSNVVSFIVTLSDAVALISAIRRR